MLVSCFRCFLSFVKKITDKKKNKYIPRSRIHLSIKVVLAIKNLKDIFLSLEKALKSNIYFIMSNLIYKRTINGLVCLNLSRERASKFY